MKEKKNVPRSPSEAALVKCQTLSSCLTDRNLEADWPQTCTQTRRCISSCSRASPGRASTAPSGRDTACRHPGEPGSPSVFSTACLQNKKQKGKKKYSWGVECWNMTSALSGQSSWKQLRMAKVIWNTILSVKVISEKIKPGIQIMASSNNKESLKTLRYSMMYSCTVS